VIAKVRLRPCAPRRDCVSTQASADDTRRYVTPLRVAAAPDVVLRAVDRAVGAIARVRVLERDEITVHAVVRSRFLRLATDIDVRLDAVRGLVHVRVSAPPALRRRSRAREIATGLLSATDRAVRRSA
jgi:uncharacterized protein (DUF1499 family)